MTRSEILFEQFCSANNICCERVEETISKTPDYLIKKNGLEVIVEVKQVDPNSQEKGLIKTFEKNGFMTRSSTPGERVRKKIKDSGPQISEFAKGKCPSLLVLYNNLPPYFSDPLCSYNIRVGMYGLETINFDVPSDPSIPCQILDCGFGPKYRMTKTSHTSISALGVLKNTPGEKLKLYLFHNSYASIPLPLGSFTSENCLEFILDTKQGREFQEWVSGALS